MVVTKWQYSLSNKEVWDRINQEPVAKQILRTEEKMVQDWTYMEKSNNKYHESLSQENGAGWWQKSCGKEIHMQRQQRVHWRLVIHYGLCHGARSNVKVNVIKHWDSCVGGHLMITDVHIHFT